MLTTHYEDDPCAITVPYAPVFDEIRRNSGFVDLRGRPDLVAQIPEAANSLNLKALLIALSQSESPLFTLACDLGTHEENTTVPVRYGAGGYLQVMKGNFTDASSQEYLDMAQTISAEVEKESVSSRASRIENTFAETAAATAPGAGKRSSPRL